MIDADVGLVIALGLASLAKAIDYALSCARDAGARPVEPLPLAMARRFRR